MLTNDSGNIVYAMTNPFGYYRFLNVEVGRSYIISVGSKRYTFAPRVIDVSDGIANLDFVAEPK